jgi:hypothetical protein
MENIETQNLEGFSRDALEAQLADIERRISIIEREVDARASKFEAYPDFAEQEQELQILETQKQRLRKLLGV